MPNQSVEGGRTSPDAQEAEKPQQQPQQETVPTGCSVYVGNLAWGVRNNELFSHMSQVGEVVRADVFEDINGKSKGCAVVVYKDEQSAKRAIAELTDSRLQERPIFVREDREEGSKLPGSGGRGRGRGRGGYSGRGYSNYVNSVPQGVSQGAPVNSGAVNTVGRQVFISNLPWKTTWQDLKELFKECGEVLRADVMELPGGRSKGMGTVLFATPDGARAAIETFNNYSLDGRNIFVRYDRKQLL